MRAYKGEFSQTRFATRWHSQPPMGEANKMTAPQRSALGPVGIPAAEWCLLITARPNLLLVGTEGATDAVLLALEPDLFGPIWTWDMEKRLSLPEPPSGTLILREVAALSEDQQTDLFRWLNHSESRVQVVSTTTAPLFAMVQHGVFRAELYYRLNIMRVDLNLFE